MMRVIGLCVVTGLLFSAHPAAAQNDSWLWQFGQELREDHGNFYSAESLGWLGGGLVVGGVLANTDMDEDIHVWYQDDARSSGTDDLSKIVKPFGEGLLAVPVYAGACLAHVVFPGDDACGVVGIWGRRSLRAVLVGAPPLLVLQTALGGARPTDDDDSTWRPLNDANGVSGHAFMGATPFLTAARMSEEPLMKSLFYGGSVLCGLSRINDEDHYFSQSLLGWWLAFLASNAVDRTQTGERRVELVPIMIEDYAGLGLVCVF